MSIPLKPPTVILTGGSRGIGLSCLKLLLRPPISANVVSLARSFPQELQELKKLNHDRLLIIQGDVAKDQDNQAAVEAAIKSFGSIDGLILNSGIIQFGRIDDQQSSIESWKQVFDVNFFSLVSILRHSLVHLRHSKGRIVFVSSGASVGSYPALGRYSASKAAMNSLCRTLASEEPSITSIALRPGVVDTAMQAQLRSQDAKDVMASSDYEHLSNLHAESKLLEPEIPAKVIVNLIMKAEQKLSGQFLSWDSDELAGYHSNTAS